MDDKLESAAQMLEQRAGNTVYRKAWKAAAKLIRSMKTAEEVNPQSPEVNPQKRANQCIGQKCP